MDKDQEAIIDQVLNTGGETESPPSQGITNVNFDFVGEDTVPADRFMNYQKLAQGMYPVGTLEEYQGQAERLYPEQNYGREKFFADIMLGLGLISGRSEGGRWAPILEKELGEYFQQTAPIAEAQRQREAQMQQFITTERQEDIDQQREFLSSIVQKDIIAQLEFMEKWNTLTKEEAEGLGYPTAQGQVYQQSSMDDEIRPVISHVNLYDKWEIISPADASVAGLDTSLGQVYMQNEADEDIKLVPGFRVKEGEVVLTEAQARAQGLTVKDGQVYKAKAIYAGDGQTILRYDDIQELQAPLAMFKILSDEEALAKNLKTDRGQIYQVNTLNDEVETLPEEYWREGYKTITNQTAANEYGIDLENYPPGTVFQVDADDQIHVAVTGTQVKERDTRIAYYKDMIMRNDPKMDDQAAMDLAVKYADNKITLSQDDVGRIFATDAFKNETTWVNKNMWEMGDRQWQLIGAVQSTDPYVNEIPAPSIDIATLTDANIEATQTKITDLEKASAQAQFLIRALEESVGPKAFWRGFRTNWFAPMATGMGDDWVQFVKDEKNRKAVTLFTRTLIQALALNPRFPVAEQDIIKELGSEEDIMAFWSDPTVAVGKFNELMRFLQNNLNWERAVLNPDKEKPFLFQDVIPSGTKNDPIDMRDPEGIKFALQLKNKISKEQFEEIYFITPDGKKVYGADLQIDMEEE
jgi:cell wall assembly regulator SMI1